MEPTMHKFPMSYSLEVPPVQTEVALTKRREESSAKDDASSNQESASESCSNASRTYSSCLLPQLELRSRRRFLSTILTKNDVFLLRCIVNSQGGLPRILYKQTTYYCGDLDEKCVHKNLKIYFVDTSHLLSNTSSDMFENDMTIETNIYVLQYVH